MRPDVYAKGGDYSVETLAEARQVAAWGGRALVLPYRAGCSTTAIVERIHRSQTVQTATSADAALADAALADPGDEPC